MATLNRQHAIRLLVIALAVLVTHQASAIIIDGKFDAYEGYTQVSTIQPTKDEDKVPPSEVYMAQEWITTTSSVVSFAVILPLEYVDNTYGVNTVDGYGKDGDKTHTFAELLGSDKAGFSFYLGDDPEAVNNELSLSFLMDYIYLDANGGYDSGVLSAEDAEGLDNTAKYDGSNKPHNHDHDGDGQNDPSKNPLVGDMAWLIGSATSLDYNLNNVGEYLVDSPGFTGDPYNTSLEPDWIYEVVYEFQIDGAAFGNMDIFGPGGIGFADGFHMIMDELHASPSKLGQFKDVPPDDPFPYEPPPVPNTPDIPEPATLLMMGIGVAVLGRRLKRD